MRPIVQRPHRIRQLPVIAHPGAGLGHIQCSQVDMPSSPFHPSDDTIFIPPSTLQDRRQSPLTSSFSLRDYQQRTRAEARERRGYGRPGLGRLWKCPTRPAHWFASIAPTTAALRSPRPRPEARSACPGIPWRSGLEPPQITAVKTYIKVGETLKRRKFLGNGTNSPYL